MVSYESLELQGEENCGYLYERLMPARGYFWHKGDMIIEAKEMSRETLMTCNLHKGSYNEEKCINKKDDC